MMLAVMLSALSLQTAASEYSGAVGIPSEERRHQLCIKKWQSSIAYKEQGCRGEVRWYHFWMDELTLSINNERINMHYSRCVVSVTCKNDPTVLNTICDALTDFDIDKARLQ